MAPCALGARLPAGDDNFLANLDTAGKIPRVPGSRAVLSRHRLAPLEHDSYGLRTAGSGRIGAKENGRSIIIGGHGRFSLGAGG
jgi:hypothetical protein